MAVQCTFCGSALKDDARYCNHCGTLVATHPFSPKSANESKFPRQNDHTGETKREQVTQQPTYGTGRRSTQDKPPLWMDHLADVRRGNVSPNPPNNAVSRELQETSSDFPQLEFPESEAMRHSNTSARELHVKIWEQQEPIRPATPAMQGFSLDDDLEDVPTKPLQADFSGAQRKQNMAQRPPSKAQRTRFDEVEELDTVPLASQMEAKSIPASWPSEEAMQRQERPRLRSSDVSNRAAYPRMSPSTPGYLRSVRQHNQERMGVSPETPTQAWKQTPPAQLAVSSFAPSKQQKSRKLLPIILLLLLLLVLVGGVGTWIVRYQPFSVPAITQPQQQLSNAQLGFSLLYPSGWQTQLDRNKSTIRLFDSSHTAQVAIVVGAAPNGDVSQYLQQQASQLGLTGIKKGSTRSFAGATWQQIQGNVQQRGASYTETLLATTHKNNLFTIMLLAPQTIYAEEEQVAFSKMCSSFQFL